MKLRIEVGAEGNDSDTHKVLIKKDIHECLKQFMKNGV